MKLPVSAAKTSQWFSAGSRFSEHVKVVLRVAPLKIVRTDATYMYERQSFH